MTRLSFCLLGALLAAPAWAQEPAAARPWPFAGSDIPVHPRLRFGRLDNGLRFVWMANAEPEHRSYLRLHVDAGSFHEADGERGMAHFLEHMAFNGSRQFPAGTLVEWFQSRGMAFGADTNAMTDFGQTVYQLDLPNSDPEALREGLRVLRDFADGLLLEEAEVQAEKGVIDGEERERDSAGFRMAVRALALAYDGTRVPERLPIGRKAERDAFDAAKLRAFYQRWYRPENATLVLVGDLEALDPEALIRAAFADWARPATPVAPEPARGAPSGAHPFYAVFEREIPIANLTVTMTEPDRVEPLTVAEWQSAVPALYARAMVDLRFAEAAKKDGAPFLSAQLQRAEGTDTFGFFQGEALDLTCKPEQWRAALAACEQELRRALQFGFAPAELEEVRADALRALDEAVEREATTPSAVYVDQILYACEEVSVPTDAATRRAILRPAIERLTPEACQQALAANWSRGRLSIAALGGLELGADAAEQLAAAWSDSRKAAVVKPAAATVARFAYASPAEDPCGIAADQRFEDLGVRRVDFANGVRLWLKRTEFKERQILVSAQVGAGALSLPPEQFPLAHVASQVFDQCGLEAHSEDDLRRLTAGKQVGVGAEVGTNAVSLGGSTTAEDLLLQCELMCAYLEHPGWREEGMRGYQKRAPQFYEFLNHQPSAPILHDFIPALHGGDPRFGLPPLEQVQQIELEQLRAWLTPRFAADPVTVVMVGDLDEAAAIAAAARSFGRLAQRPAPAPPAQPPSFPGMRTGLRQEHTVDTEVPNAVVMVAFPTTDGFDPRRRLALSLLGLVADDRLRLVVREQLGASYSPGASAESSTVFPGLGFLMMQAAAEPEAAPELLAACLQVAGELAEDGVDAAELQRLKEPLSKQLRDEQRENGYWLGVLSELHQRPAALDDVRRLWSDLEAIDAAEVNRLAKEYLPEQRASSVIVRPRASAESGD